MHGPVRNQVPRVERQGRIDADRSATKRTPFQKRSFDGRRELAWGSGYPAHRVTQSFESLMLWCVYSVCGFPTRSEFKNVGLERACDEDGYSDPERCDLHGKGFSPTFQGRFAPRVGAGQRYPPKGCLAGHDNNPSMSTRCIPGRRWRVRRIGPKNSS